MLASLFNAFTDVEGLNKLAFANGDLHFRMNQILNGRYNLQIPDYVLDPIPLSDGLAAWLQRHQETHTRVNQALGIAGSDLTDVDFQKPDQIASWVWLHAQEHVQAANKLGIS
jgi:1-acyl-sn-glycerol-3-phosphate acyltransferase